MAIDVPVKSDEERRADRGQEQGLERGRSGFSDQEAGVVEESPVDDDTIRSMP